MGSPEAGFRGAPGLQRDFPRIREIPERYDSYEVRAVRAYERTTGIAHPLKMTRSKRRAAIHFCNGFAPCRVSIEVNRKPVIRRLARHHPVDNHVARHIAGRPRLYDLGTGGQKGLALLVPEQVCCGSQLGHHVARKASERPGIQVLQDHMGAFVLHP